MLQRKTKLKILSLTLALTLFYIQNHQMSQGSTHHVPMNDPIEEKMANIKETAKRVARAIIHPAG